jgi:hypothetical protein
LRRLPSRDGAERLLLWTRHKLVGHVHVAALGAKLARGCLYSDIRSRQQFDEQSLERDVWLRDAPIQNYSVKNTRLASLE